MQAWRSENTRVRGLTILAAASLSKATAGEYPATLADTTAHLPGGIPTDPVSGDSFTYWLADGRPALVWIFARRSAGIEARRFFRVSKQTIVISLFMTISSPRLRV